MTMESDQPQTPHRRVLCVVLFVLVVAVGWIPPQADQEETSSAVVELQHDDDKNETGAALHNHKKQPHVAQDGTVFSHYYLHLPKTGGSYGFSVLKDLYHKYQKERKELTGAPCMVGAPVSEFEDFPRTKTSHGDTVNCTLWSTEDVYTDQAQHVYTLIRDPHPHVLSMYFHMAESAKGKESRKQKTQEAGLDAWLEAWVEVLEGKNNTKETRNRFGGGYIPINLQSSRTHFQYNETNNGDDALLAAQQDLLDRFAVLGDAAQNVKSTCATFIRYYGWVPSECNCTGRTSEDKKESSTLRPNRRPTRGRSLVRNYNVSKDSHGVQHHGATFVTTPHQDAQIAKLTAMDAILYNLTKQVFAQQVEALETEYKVQLCSQF